MGADEKLGKIGSGHGDTGFTEDSKDPVHRLIRSELSSLYLCGAMVPRCPPPPSAPFFPLTTENWHWQLSDNIFG